MPAEQHLLKPASKPSTKRYSDIDTSILSKKDARLTE
jgi:hypothetical protein